MNQTHLDAVEENTIRPWERVAIETEALGRRVGTNQNIFPVIDVFQLLLRYDVDHYRNVNPETHQLELAPDGQHPIDWHIEIFFRLNAPIENLVSILEAMWYARDAPYNSRAGRKLLAKWLVTVVEKWYAATQRSDEPFGSPENALGLSDVLRVVAESGDFAAAGATPEDAIWAEKLRAVRVVVEEVAR